MANIVEQSARRIDKKGKFNRNVSFLLCNFNIFLPFPARSRDMVGYFGVEIMMEEGIRDA